MFQMKEVGRKIAESRKEKNMTQMELADAMGVSFQAVSNWERGNSMPDIGKLPELSRLLGLSIDGLLDDEKPARLIQHILDGDSPEYLIEENVQPQTVAEVAPILKPDQAESILDEVLLHNADRITLDDLLSVAPFVSNTFLNEWATQVSEVGDIRQLASLAAFLPTPTMDLLVDKLLKTDYSVRDLLPLAPFLSKEALNKLVEKSIGETQLDDLSSLAPFLSTGALDEIVHRLSRTGEVSIRKLTGLAPFLSEDSLDWLATSALNNATPDDVVALAPFLSSRTLQRCANELIARYGIKAIKKLAPFL